MVGQEHRDGVFDEAVGVLGTGQAEGHGPEQRALDQPPEQCRGAVGVGDAQDTRCVGRPKPPTSASSPWLTWDSAC